MITRRLSFAGVAVLALIGLSFFLVAGCSDESEELVPASASPKTPSPTASTLPSASASPEPTPVLGAPSAYFEQFRAFAAEIDSAVTSGDAAFFAVRGVEIEVTCRGDEQVGQCTNQPAGTVLRGIPGAAWQSDAFALNPRAEYEQLVSQWFASALPNQSDRYGDGAPRLVALAQSSNQEVLAIASLLQDIGSQQGIQRQCRIFRFSFVDSDWVLVGELFCYATATSDDWLSGMCAECYDYWERWEET
jgi:hypothetical protein